MSLAGISEIRVVEVDDVGAVGGGGAVHGVPPDTK